MRTIIPDLRTFNRNPRPEVDARVAPDGGEEVVLVDGYRRGRDFWALVPVDRHTLKPMMRRYRKSESTFAAQMKSFSERPPTAWVL
jgi:hypothetical protein